MKRNWFVFVSVMAILTMALVACGTRPAATTEAPQLSATIKPTEASQLPTSTVEKPTEASQLPTATVEKPTEIPQPAAVTKLTFMAMGGDDAQGNTFDSLTKQFNDTVGKDKGIEVTYIRVPADWPEYNQKVVAAIAAGTSPDIINLSPLNKMDYTTNNYLLDLNPLMAADKLDTSLWYAPTFDAWKDNQGHQFAIGHGIYTEAIFYNKNMFKAAGLTPPSLEWDNSWTWDEFADYARKLTKGEGATKQYGLWSEPQLGWMTPIFRSYCGSIGVADGSRLNMESQGSIAALQFLTDLMWKDGTTPRSEVTSATPAYQLFETGKIAMFWDGSWQMSGFASTIKDFDWGILPLPKGKCGTFTGYWVDAFAIPAASKSPNAAFEFVKFMIGDVATNAYVDQNLFGIPGMISVAESRANDLFKPLSTEEAKVWLDSAKYGATPEYTLNWNEVWDSTNKIIQQIELGEITAADAGKLMDTEADRIIKAAKQ